MKSVPSEQAVFAKAIQCATLEARAAYLEAACQGDAALRRRVEDLLRAAQNAGDFLEQPPPGLTSDAGSFSGNIDLSEKPGDRIGSYKLLQEVGEGGCGVVYMAEQEAPVRRRVALKLIKLGMDTRSAIARFEAEGQALALMDHPNIARVFDAGATVTGRPFLVMELVRGLPITTFCEDNQLPVNDRLELFIQVCHAIQHAHQKGIIHRDLKPSNILVTINDGMAVPKVIDFGIAKAIERKLTDKTLFTEFLALLGTPAYISPEQAEMSSVDIDTRSDIYSLGVLLYELLTGHTPFDGETLLRSGLDEMRRIIREDQPPRPSTRLTRLATTGTRKTRRPPRSDHTSTGRLLPTKELIRAVRGDLDWIVMKCLEKDRSRRYETAASLAGDIQGHLDREPIQARPVNALGRLWRWCLRHPATATWSVIVLVLFTFVAIGSTVAAWRVTSARRAELEERAKAEIANRELRDTNVRLADTVNLLELRHAEDLFRINDSPMGVAQLAALLRRDPSNQVAASRLVSALIHRNWALPTIAPMRHLDRVTTACFSPDGRRLLSASYDKTAQIWDAASGEIVVSIRHLDRVMCADYSPDGTRVVTASFDGTARIWDATNGVPILSLDHQPRQVRWAEFSPNGQRVLTVCAGDKTVRIWSVGRGALIQELGGHRSEVLLAHFSPDGQQVVSAGRSGSLRLWSIDSGTTLLRVEAHFQDVDALAFSPDRRTLASGSGDGTARLWDASTGQPLGAPLLHEDGVRHVAFSPDGTFLLTTSKDYTARLWHGTNGIPIGQPWLHEGGVIFGAFSRDGTKAVTTSMDNSARLWEVPTGRPFCQPLRQLEAILHASFSPNGRRLVTASADQTVQVWNIQPRRYLGTTMRHGNPITTVAFNPKTDSVASASLDGTVRLWNARTGQPLGGPMHHQAQVLSLDFSVEGRRLVTASADGAAYVWDAQTGQRLAGPLQHTQAIRSVHFSPDGERLVTASADGTAQVWDARSGQPLLPPLEHGSRVNAARFSPNGQWIVTASENGRAWVWDARTGQRVTGPLRHADHVEWAEFSPDSQRVVSASSDNTARVWDARTGQPVGTPFEHTRTVVKAVFSPDGRRVATASLDRTARIWDAATGEALTGSLLHERSVSQVCFSADGQRLLTSCWSGHSRLWDAQTGRPLTEWLDGGGSGWNACFDATGRRSVTGGTDGMLHVWDIPPVPTPVPDWFLVLAETITGRHLNAQGNPEWVPRQGLQGLSQLLDQNQVGDFYGRLSRWFLADPSQRAASPF